MADFETEITRTIWNNKLGTKIIVKPDSDSLGLITIVAPDGEVTIGPDEARLLAPALIATANEVEATQS